MQHQIGRHSIREDGDTLHMRIVGDFEQAEMVQILALIDSVVEREGGWAVVADVREMVRVTHEARQCASKWANVKLGYATAVVRSGCCDAHHDFFDLQGHGAHLGQAQQRRLREVRS